MGIFARIRAYRAAMKLLERADEVSKAVQELPLDHPPGDHQDVFQMIAELRVHPFERFPRLGRMQRKMLAGLLGHLGPDHFAEANALFFALRREEPGDRNVHWNHSLLLKRTGHFVEALAAIDAYRAAGGLYEKALAWNSGICATGAGLGERALEVWKTLGNKIEMGDDGLPNGKYPAWQVRISSRGPLAGPPRQREEGDPAFENGWVAPRSPCHGVLITPLMINGTADVGDVLLWDGAPVRTKEINGEFIHTFPLIKIIKQGGFSRFRFMGEQRESGLIAALQDSLPRGTQLYVHSESVVNLCAQCARSSAPAVHDHDELRPQRIVSGKLAVPPGISLESVRAQLAESLRVRTSIRLAVPSLHRAAGDEAAALIDDALWAQWYQPAPE